VNKRGKDLRISSWREISFILRNGSRWKSPSFNVVFIKNCGENDRTAVLVSKGNGNAVQRNRIKRVFKEIVFKNRSKTPPYFDILIKPVGNVPPPAEKINGDFLLWKKAITESGVFSFQG
jgi:ribonuclease P protein component